MSIYKLLVLKFQFFRLCLSLNYLERVPCIVILFLKFYKLERILGFYALLIAVQATSKNNLTHHFLTTYLVQILIICKQCLLILLFLYK